MKVDLKYHLITLGCQMNKSDSERVAALLERLDMTETQLEAEADLILVNSCSVRQTAEDRIFGKMADFLRLKERKPKLIVGVTGCLPGRDSDGKIRARLKAVDLYFPIRDLPQLPRWLAELNPDICNTADSESDYLKIVPRYSSTKQAYLTIQTGCNKFCTYCVVPFSRGLEKNRSVADILTEARSRVELGTVEVTLLGQTVNSFKAMDPENFSKNNPYKNDFAALLFELNQISGLERIHFTAPHPLHLTDEVIEALTLPKHLNFLHLPVQAGNNEVLRRMNRRYTREMYLDLVAKIKNKIPQIALGTDIIVGFCGESDDQFQDTISLYRQADFDIAYTAMYSPRSGTAGYKAFKDDVTPEIKKQRWRALQNLMEETVLAKNQKYLGQVVEVLVDGFDHDLCSGQSRELKLVRFKSAQDRTGQMVKVKITKAMEWMLLGEEI